MIRLDLSTLSEQELRTVVTRRCAEFGPVANVTIIKHDHGYNFALAAVEMANAADSLSVLKKLGDSKVDNLIVIRVEQE